MFGYLNEYLVFSAAEEKQPMKQVVTLKKKGQCSFLGENLFL